MNKFFQVIINEMEMIKEANVCCPENAFCNEILYRIDYNPTKGWAEDDVKLLTQIKQVSIRISIIIHSHIR